METLEGEVLKEVIADCAKDNGWANLAEVGILLRNKNISYGKLSKFVSKFPEIIETRVDESKQPPVAYARLIEIPPDIP
ncbi:MAG: OST-HTH/LOTUS domain-containing protein [Mariniphaga sp.]